MNDPTLPTYPFQPPFLILILLLTIIVFIVVIFHLDVIATIVLVQVDVVACRNKEKINK